MVSLAFWSPLSTATFYSFHWQFAGTPLSTLARIQPNFEVRDTNQGPNVEVAVAFRTELASWARDLILISLELRPLSIHSSSLNSCSFQICQKFY